MAGESFSRNQISNPTIIPLKKQKLYVLNAVLQHDTRMILRDQNQLTPDIFNPHSEKGLPYLSNRFFNPKNHFYAFYPSESYLMYLCNPAAANRH
jgi:hypothetical protein